MRLLLCALLITSNAIACDYESNDIIQYEGSIESVRVIDKKSGTTDHDIEEAVLEGAQTFEDVQRKTKVGVGNTKIQQEE